MPLDGVSNVFTKGKVQPKKTQDWGSPEVSRNQVTDPGIGFNQGPQKKQALDPAKLMLLAQKYKVQPTGDYDTDITALKAAGATNEELSGKKSTGEKIEISTGDKLVTAA